jgi:ferric-dicitrate binding protein FerR (iron transport regulator)
MNPQRIVAVTAALFVWSLILMVGLTGFSLGGEEACPAVTVAYVEGEATLTPTGRDTSVVLSEDRVVNTGDRIDTGKDGSVELLLPDESVVRVGPESRIVVREAGYVEVTKKSSNVLNLLYGKVRAVVAPLLNAESRFIIETENTTVGVRGTDFVVSHDKTAGETDVLCSDGTVELKPKDVVRKGLSPILVRGNEGVRLVRGKIPEKPGRWVDANRVKLLRNLDFKGKRTKKIIEKRLKYLQNKGESAVNDIKRDGNVIKHKTNRVIRRIFR